MVLVTAPPVRPLEAGERMDRWEFHRRYEADASVKHAELIEGVVYVSSPLRALYHGDPENDLATWLGVYRASRPELRVSHNATVYLDDDNEPQPDLSLRRTSGGQTRVEDGYIHCAPDLIVEIAASSASIDLHEKMRAYRRNGVKEYIVLRVFDAELDWFVLEAREYVRLQPDSAGVLESREFPGLRLNIPKLLAGDLAGVLAEVG